MVQLQEVKSANKDPFPHGRAAVLKSADKDPFPNGRAAGEGH